MINKIWIYKTIPLIGIFGNGCRYSIVWTARPNSLHGCRSKFFGFFHIFEEKIKIWLSFFGICLVWLQPKAYKYSSRRKQLTTANIWVQQWNDLFQWFCSFIGNITHMYQKKFFLVHVCYVSNKRTKSLKQIVSLLYSNIRSSQLFSSTWVFIRFGLQSHQADSKKRQSDFYFFFKNVKKTKEFTSTTM